MEDTDSKEQYPEDNLESEAPTYFEDQPPLEEKYYPEEPGAKFFDAKMILILLSLPIVAILFFLFKGTVVDSLTNSYSLNTALDEKEIRAVSSQYILLIKLPSAQVCNLIDKKALGEITKTGSLAECQDKYNQKKKEKRSLYDDQSWKKRKKKLKDQAVENYEKVEVSQSENTATATIGSKSLGLVEKESDWLISKKP